MDSFLGEIRLFAGNYAPQDWALCDGSLLAIAQYDALFSLLGTTYGGDGNTTFGVPDLRGRVPVHRSGTMPQGQLGGFESVTLLPGQVGKHQHGFVATKDAGVADVPALKTVGSNTTIKMWSGEQANAPLSSAAVTTSGNATPHDNMHPFQAVTYIISLAGVFPPHP